MIKIKKNKSSNFHLCSFSNSSSIFAESRERLQKQAEDFKLFDSISLYNESDLSDSFVSDFKEYLKSDIRGFGYWVWKPWVILETLKRLNENDILLYVDMGCNLNSNGRKKMLSYKKEVMENESGFLVSQLDDDKLGYIWTKGDLLDYFQVRDKPDIISTPQYQGGIIFIRKNSQTISLIQSWLNVFYHDFHLADDTPSISKNEDGFIEHRHDQSIISILLKKNGTSTIPLFEIFADHKYYYKCPIHVHINLYPRFANTYPIKKRRWFNWK